MGKQGTGRKEKSRFGGGGDTFPSITKRPGRVGAKGHLDLGGKKKKRTLEKKKCGQDLPGGQLKKENPWLGKKLSKEMGFNNEGVS